MMTWDTHGEKRGVLSSGMERPFRCGAPPTLWCRGLPVPCLQEPLPAAGALPMGALSPA